MKFRGLILAGGRGSRFVSEVAAPKVLRPLAGKALIDYVIAALRGGGVEDITVITGYMAEEVRRHCGGAVKYAFQPEQKGSGDAVRCAAPLFADFDGGVVIMCGDSPFFTADTVRRMRETHEETGAAVTLGTAVLADPTGYGRIKRTGGKVAGIVEEKCASAEEKAIKEIGGGIYVYDSRWLFERIGNLTKNAAGEYNLTETVSFAVSAGDVVSAAEIDAAEIVGVNTPEELAAAEKSMKNR
ncbi:MAG: NTP transferase domain-containing protein [Abditibacteriota bacterium]|nr:NTP transferase domain-containing protein [Abditibacteriota bacterium]MBP5092882.1 NTP transferase domain-containing protein [Abditibacteriota bacterium]MBP5737748.1 NTP transferase domain-containing protein [Abditibacteriota bacterium]